MTELTEFGRIVIAKKGQATALTTSHSYGSQLLVLTYVLFDEFLKMAATALFTVLLERLILDETQTPIFA